MNPLLTTFYWAPRRRSLLLVSIMSLVVAILLVSAWVFDRERGRNLWMNPLTFFLLFQVYTVASQTLFVVSHGVLVIFSTRGLPARAVPLGISEVRREKRQWRLRWPEGRRRPYATIPAEPDLTRLVEEALAHPAEAAPQTEREAGQVVTVANAPYPFTWKHWALLAALVAAIGAAFWLNQPLFLIPILGLPLVAVYDRPRALILTPDSLWIAEPGRDPVRFDRQQVRAESAKGQPRLLLPLSTLPMVRLNRVSGAALAARLEHGDLPLERPHSSTPAETMARCSLCGRPLAGSAHPGEARFCDACANRTRLEATDGGAGLAGRERKPL